MKVQAYLTAAAINLKRLAAALLITLIGVFIATLQHRSTRLAPT